MKLRRSASEKLARVAHRHQIRLILVFGSAVTGRLHPESDLDLALLLQNADQDFAKLEEIRRDLQAVFPDQDLDLSIINRADPLFLKKITENCRLLFGEESDMHRLKIYAFRRYQDHRRFLEMERRYAERFIREVNERP